MTSLPRYIDRDALIVEIGTAVFDMLTQLDVGFVSLAADKLSTAIEVCESIQNISGSLAAMKVTLEYPYKPERYASDLSSVEFTDIDE